LKNRPRLQGKRTQSGKPRTAGKGEKFEDLGGISTGPGKNKSAGGGKRLLEAKWREKKKTSQTREKGEGGVAETVTTEKTKTWLVKKTSPRVGKESHIVDDERENNYNFSDEDKENMSERKGSRSGRRTRSRDSRENRA